MVFLKYFCVQSMPKIDVFFLHLSQETNYSKRPYAYKIKIKNSILL